MILDTYKWNTLSIFSYFLFFDSITTFNRLRILNFVKKKTIFLIRFFNDYEKVFSCVYVNVDEIHKLTRVGVLVTKIFDCHYNF